MIIIVNLFSSMANIGAITYNWQVFKRMWLTNWRGWYPHSNIRGISDAEFNYWGQKRNGNLSYTGL